MLTVPALVVTLTSVTAPAHPRPGARCAGEGALCATAGLVPAAFGGAVSGRLPAGAPDSPLGQIGRALTALRERSSPSTAYGPPP
jgi:uncharacterized protein